MPTKPRTYKIDRTTTPGDCEGANCETGNQGKFILLAGGGSVRLCPGCLLKLNKQIADLLHKWYKESH